MFAVFLVLPVGMHRPVYTEESLGERLMLAVFAVDRETNCFPSGHTIFAILSGLLVRHGRAPGAGCKYSDGCLLFPYATTITTGQHYYADVAAGVLTVLAGYFLSLRLEHSRIRLPVGDGRV